MPLRAGSIEYVNSFEWSQGVHEYGQRVAMALHVLSCNLLSL